MAYIKPLLLWLTKWQELSGWIWQKINHIIHQLLNKPNNEVR